MKKTYGVELEMCIYYNDRDKLNQLYSAFENKGYEVDDDGSLHRELAPKYDFSETREMKSPVIGDTHLFLKDLRNILFSKRNPYTVSINENGGDIRIDFNHSTGTHIHFASEFVSGIKSYDENDNYNSEDKEGDFYITSGTQELKYFDEEICTNLLKYFHKSTKKYPTIQNAYYREYAKSDISYYNRHSGINISNAHEHGTIEFRICNLRGVTSKTIIPALRFQLDLVNRSIKRGYRLYLKSVINKKKKALIEYQDKINDIKKSVTKVKTLLEEEKNGNKISRKQESLGNYTAA